MLYSSYATRILFYLNRSGTLLDRVMTPKSELGQEISPLFIIGLPRSGTTLLYQIIVNNFHIAYFNHLMDYLYGMPNCVARITRHFNTQTPYPYESFYGHIRGLLSPSESPNFWFYYLHHFDNSSHKINESLVGTKKMNDLRRSVADICAIQQKQYVYKCVYLMLNIGLLNKIFPSSRFLIIERDPFTICKSIYVARKRQKSPDTWWSIRPPGYQEYIDKSVPEQIVYQVAYCQEHLSQALDKLNDNHYCCIRYEELCEDPLSTIEEIKSWLAPSGITIRDHLHLPKRFSATSGDGLTSKETINLRSLWADYKNRSFSD